MEIVTFQGFVPSHWYLNLVSADQNFVYLDLKWQILVVIAKDLILVLITFRTFFSFNFERNKLCYFLEAERCILIILFKLIVQRQNEKFYINFSY